MGPHPGRDSGKDRDRADQRTVTSGELFPWDHAGDVPMMGLRTVVRASGPGIVESYRKDKGAAQIDARLTKLGD